MSQMSSLATKLASGLLVPFKALASGVGSLITTFLSGNWIAVIVHPITLTLIGVVMLSGWAYSKGKQHERRAQAAAIVELNKGIKLWQEAYELADDAAEAKLQAALANWRKTSGARIINAAECKIDDKTANTISDIAGD
jgi:cbb3-type cytochrome oxidase subunit 3